MFALCICIIRLLAIRQPVISNGRVCAWVAVNVTCTNLFSLHEHVSGATAESQSYLHELLCLGSVNVEVERQRLLQTIHKAHHLHTHASHAMFANTASKFLGYSMPDVHTHTPELIKAPTAITIPTNMLSFNTLQQYEQHKSPICTNQT
jgi:hypothetical protein